ncbi:MAG: hypothetical protein ABSH09_30860 [Bryobacteraceae bacterium]
MKTLTRHPEDHELLLYADGELPVRAAGRVRSHLEACWNCRSGLEELETTIGDCVRYRKDVLQPFLPSPPAPWMDIYQGFQRIDAATEPGIFTRLSKFLAPVKAHRWATAAVALLAITALLYRFLETPGVQAAGLLQKAVAAAGSRPDKPRRIEIRTSQHRLTRIAGVRSAAASSAADVDALNSLQALFVAAKYDWDDPLSARSYQAWRNQLADKRDEVTQEPGAYRVRTTTGSSELVAASLTLRTPDLTPVQERFEFRDREWVEIAEIADVSVAPNADGSGVAGSASPRKFETNAAPPASVPSMSAPAMPAPASIGDELHVFASLHQIGADLGDPIEVTRTGGTVVVGGVGLDPHLRQEINDALGNDPHVTVRFSDSSPPVARPDRSVAPETAVNPDLRQLQARMADQVGGRVRFDELAAQVLDLSDNMMARAYALRRLAEHFPPESESGLSPADLDQLQRIRQEHAAVLRQRAADIDRLLRPMLVSVTGTPAKPSAISQTNAEDLFQSARQVEKLLAMMFGTVPGEAWDDRLPARLLSGITDLRARSEAFDRPTVSPDRRDR